MGLKLIWNPDNPKRPARMSDENILSGLQFALDHFDDPKNIRSKIVNAHIQLDNLGWNVVGLGWTENDGQPLVVFGYRLTNPRGPSCAYYGDPLLIPALDE